MYTPSWPACEEQAGQRYGHRLAQGEGLVVVVARASGAVPACEAAEFARLAVPASGARAARSRAALEARLAAARAVAVAPVLRLQRGFAVAEVAEEAIVSEVNLHGAWLTAMPAPAQAIEALSCWAEGGADGAAGARGLSAAAWRAARGGCAGSRHPQRQSDGIGD